MGESEEGQGGERSRESLHESSEEEVTVGGGWLAFGGLDTYSV